MPVPTSPPGSTVAQVLPRELVDGETGGGEW